MCVQINKVSCLACLFPCCYTARIVGNGSRARGKFGATSDIDLVLDGGGRLDELALDEARVLLNETYMPYTIDLVDLHAVKDDFKDEITKDMIPWN